REMRSQCPVGRSTAYGGFWAAVSYEAVAQAARDTETFTSWKDVPAGSGPLLGANLPDINPAYRQGFAEMDGPMHVAIRQALARFFTPSSTEGLRPEIARYTTWCIDQFIETGRADMVNDLAGPVPALLSVR